MSLSPKDPFEAIREHLASIEARPIAKATLSFRDAQRRKVHAAFVAAIDALTERGASMRSIAERLDVHGVTLLDWYNAGDSKRSQVPAWVFAALPAEARAVWMRVALEWSDPPPGRTGTDG